MPQEDYLKKQFDRLARVLGKILADLLGLKYTIDFDQGLEIVTEINEPELGFNPGQLIDLPNHRFIEQLTAGQNFNNENLESLANIFLFLVENTSSSEQILDRKKTLAQKCLLIWEYLEKTEASYSFDRHSKMERIQKLLQSDFKIKE